MDKEPQKYSKMVVLKERERQRIQTALDNTTSKEHRKQLGQFPTSFALACEITQEALSILASHTNKQDSELPTWTCNSPIRFLEPAAGTGAFLSALLSYVEKDQIKSIIGFEVDPDVAGKADKLWREMGVHIENADFTEVDSISEKANLILTNPCWIRHHRIPPETKTRLKKRIFEKLKITVSGLAGLYLYFLLIADEWLALDGAAAWIMPSELLDANYGKAAKEYLLNKADLVRIHRLDPHSSEFGGATVSASVIWFVKRDSKATPEVQFTYGSSVLRPDSSKSVHKKEMDCQQKWTRYK